MFDVLTRHFHSLIIFKTAIEMGSFNRAAAKLKMTQPAVTRSIARLEETLGFRLLERRSSGVLPTDYGRTLLGHVEAAVREMEIGGQSLAMLHRTRKNAVVAAGSAVNMTIVAAAAHRFQKLRAQQPLRLIEGATPAMLDLLLAGELDFVVGSHIQAEIDEHLIAEPLLDEQLGVFASASNPLQLTGQVKMAELFQTARWIMPDAGTHLHAYIREMLVAHDLELPGRLIESRSISAIRWTVQNTDTLSLGTSLLHLPELLSGEVKLLSTDWVFPVTQHTIYRRPLRLMPRAAMALIKEIKVEARAIAVRQQQLASDNA